MPLPKVEAPSIDGLILKVPAEKVPTPDDVMARLEEHRRAHAVATQKKNGDVIGPFDEVCVDLIGYANGKLVPGSAQFGLWVRIDRPLSFPELAAALKLATVGDGLKVNLTLPESFFIPALRNTPAVYLMDVKEAQQLKLPKLDDPGFLAKIGGAKTLPEALNKIAEELGAQFAVAATFRALHVAIESVAARAEVQLSPKLLQQELWNVWREVEGKALSEHGLLGQEQVDSFENWKDDPKAVADVERRLRNTIVMMAVAKAHEAELTHERLVETAVRWVSVLGISEEKLAEFKHQDDATKSQTGALLMEIAAAELVLERSTLSWVTA